VAVLLEPGFEATCDSGRLRHAADTRRQVEHALALGYGELTEQEESLARLGSDPVRIAPSRIQIRAGGLFRRLRCDLREEVLDLERSQLLVLRQVQVVHSHRHLLNEPAALRGRRDQPAVRTAERFDQDISMMMTIPQM